MQQTSDATDVRDDRALMALVANQRDETAFADLFRKYERAAYSLAMNIVGDRKLAEEAVQEGMLRVWSGAGTFRQDSEDGASGGVRPWIMKIVARESFRAFGKRKRRSREVHQEIELAAEAPRDEIASEELTAALRQKLNEISPEDRQLITLHFGGGLSQREIGETLAIPQQTVSHRIKSAIKELRSGLATAGFASATLVTSESLQSVLSSGHVPPPSLLAATEARLQTRPSFKNRRVSPGSSSAGTLAAIVVVVLCLAATAAWYAASQKPAVLPAPSRPASPSAGAPASIKPSVSVDAPAPAAKSYRWTFEQDAPQELMVGNGTQWRWVPEQKAMLADPNVTIGFAGVQLPAGPAVFTADADLAPGKARFDYGTVLWTNDGAYPQNASWCLPPVKAAAHKSLKKTYFIGAYVIDCLNDEPRRVVEYKKDHANAQLMMFATNLLIRELRLVPINEADIPPALRDIPKITRDMTRMDKLSAEEQIRFNQQ